MVPPPIRRFVELFSTLPTLGPRQATRLAFMIARRGKAGVADLAAALADLSTIGTCAECFTQYAPDKPGNQALCSICASPARRADVIAIVERDTDRIAIEQTKKFTGRYLVLGEIPRDGVLEPEQKLRINHLARTLEKRFGQAEEIILALNPTTLGDIEASLLLKELEPRAKKMTRLGRGLPTGGEIEFADEETLGGALEGRR